MIEPIINLIQYGLILLVSFLVIGWLGFRIPARPRKPAFTAVESTSIPTVAPNPLPEPVKKYLDVLYPDGIPSPSSIVAWGRGRISAHLRIFGSVWLPLSWSLFLKPGETYLWRVNITWFMRSFLRGGDLFRDGHGLYKMGKDELESEYIDSSEFTILWIYTLTYAPFALATLPNLSWQNIDSRSVWLTVSGPDQSAYDFKLLFDEKGALYKVETRRAASRDGKRLDFSAAIQQMLSSGSSKERLPKLKNAWESVVYLDLESAGMGYPGDIEAEIQLGL